VDWTEYAKIDTQRLFHKFKRWWIPTTEIFEPHGFLLTLKTL